MLASPLFAPCCTYIWALCKLTREELHAVSVLVAGPWNPNVKLIRPDATLRAVPVAVKGVISATYFARSCLYSTVEIPMNVPTYGAVRWWYVGSFRKDSSSDSRTLAK